MWWFTEVSVRVFTKHWSMKADWIICGEVSWFCQRDPWCRLVDFKPDRREMLMSSLNHHLLHDGDRYYPWQTSCQVHKEVTGSRIDDGEWLTRFIAVVCEVDLSQITVWMLMTAESSDVTRKLTAANSCWRSVDKNHSQSLYKHTASLLLTDTTVNHTLLKYCLFRQHHSHVLFILLQI